MPTPFPGMDPYLRAGYSDLLNYHQPPVPPLTDAEAAWAATLIQR
jgi:hypothetical protein